MLRVLLCVGFLLVAGVSQGANVSPGAVDSPTSPEDAPAGYNPVRKLGRGCANLCFGVVELPNQVTKARSEYGGAAIAYGIPKGIVRFFAREIVGVYEIVTFPIPSYRPIVKPEWPNEDFEP